MKKILIKLASLTIISVMITMNLMMVANADMVAEITELTNSKGDCIKIDPTTGDGEDKGKIITITEESYVQDSTADIDLGNGVKARKCFRKTLIYKPADKKSPIQSASGLVTPGKCSPSGTAKDQEQTICEEVTVLLASEGGSAMLQAYISMMYKWVASFAGVIAVLVIIISGIQISLAGGGGEGVDEAKGRIIKSLSGLALLFLSALILYTLNPTFFTYTKPTPAPAPAATEIIKMIS